MTDTYTSQYLTFLPPVYQQSDQTGVDPQFLTRFLLIFEAILGRGMDQVPAPDDGPSTNSTTSTTVNQMPRKGTAELIDVLPDFYYPQLAPLFPEETEEGDYLPPFSPSAMELGGVSLETYQDEVLALLNSYVGAAPPTNTTTWEAVTEEWLTDFLGWMGTWFALSENQTWDIDTRRSALAGALPMFRERGTKDGLQAALELETGLDFNIINNAVGTPLVIGSNTALTSSFETGDPILGGIRPYSFVVEVYVSTFDYTTPDILALVQTVTALVDDQKPAHAQALIQPKGYSFILGQSSVVGESTLLPLGDDQAPQEVQ